MFTLLRPDSSSADNADLRNFGTKDIISLTPICGTWEEYKRLRNEPVGSFSYDSLIMNPKENHINREIFDRLRSAL